ncbi:MAG: hypothetical protein ACWGON_10545 [Gemmatimonadota bacterium]
MVGQLVAYFAVFCAFVLLPAVILGWSIAARWLDLQQEMLQLEREKVRLLAEQARFGSEIAEGTGHPGGLTPDYSVRSAPS